MSNKIGLFAGSFDPITKGHVDLIERASKLFDSLYVGIFYNLEKKSFFSIEAKEKMVIDALSHLENVNIVTSHDELAVEVARKLGVTTFVRGLRNGQDLEYERNLNFFNDILYSVRLKNISKLENMEFCATKQRVYFSDKNKKASYKIINYGDYYDVDYYDNNLKNEVFDWIGKWS